MNDQIFCIDEEQCNQYHELVFNSYICNYRVNKNGLFSGLLKNSDLSTGDLKNYENYNYNIINKNTFFVKENELKFIQLLVKKNILFIKLRNKSLVNINDLIYSNKIKINKGLIFIEGDNKVIKTNSKTIMISFKNLTLVIIERSIYVIENKLNSQYINKLISKGKKIQECDLKKYNENDESIDGLIRKKLYLEFNKDEVHGRVFVDKINKYMDDYVWKKELSQASWLDVKKYYRYNGKSLSNDINLLIQSGWSIYNKEKKVQSMVRNNCKSHFETDWLELKIDYKVNENVISLIELINNMERDNSNYVELKNGQIVIMPNDVKENYGTIKKILMEDKIIVKPYMIDKINTIFNNQDLIKNNKYIEYEKIELNIDSTIKQKLFQYQIDGVKWLKYLKLNSYNGCLADDMGLGKTLQVLSFLFDKEVMKKNEKNLIIVPKTLLFNWKAEIENLNQDLRYLIYHGDNRINNFENINLIITTYGVISNEIEFFKKIRFENCVIDEAQLSKNHLTNRYKCLKQINSKTKIALSGTPIENNLEELYYLMDLLNPNLLGTYKEFKSKYIDLNKNLQLKELIAPFILRRTKKEVLKELPQKTETIIKCKMTVEQKYVYDITKEKIRKDIIEEKTNLNFSRVLQSINQLRQICCHPKIVTNSINIKNANSSGKFNELKNLILENINKKNKMLIFSQYTSMLKIIETWIKSNNYQYSYLDGKSSHREQIINTFIQQENNYLFLLSIKAAGVGINLVSANTVIIYDPWWNPAVENQAIDRCYRIGQDKNVEVYKLITENSIEEKILDLNIKKKDLFDNVLSNQSEIKSLRSEDIINILK